MKQAMEDVSEVLSSVVKDVDQAVSSNINGAQLLHELLSAPWLHALLKIYECLLKFQRLTPSPVLPYASGLSYEIMTVIHKAHRPSAEARELCSLLSLPDIQALLSSHDSVAQADYEPVLPPLPDELPEDEEAMRIVCLVKNNQPLSGEECRRTVGEIHNRWSSLHRFTLDRLIPARSAQSGEELRVPESEASLLLVHKESRRHPFLPRYESTGSCYFSPPTVKLRKKELNQSAPSVLSPATCTEEPKPNGKDGASTRETSDDYSYPPPPIPAYSFSLPNSPVLYKKSSTGGQSRNIPTPGKTPSCPGMNSLRAHTTPSSPATRRSTREQGVNTLPTPERQHGCQTGQTKPDNKYQEESLNHLLMFHCSSAPHHNGCHSKPKHTQNEQQQQSGHHTRPDELTKQCSVEELRSTVQMVASSIEHNSQDVRHLGESMVAASEMITNSVEENAQALNLLAEVVDKLQGLIVAKKHQESSPPLRNKQYNPPPPPPRVSSLSPKMVRKPRTLYPHPLSPSPSFTHSSSSSTSSCADDFTTPRSSTGINGGSKRMVPATQRAGRGGSNGQGATIRKDEVTGDIYIARVIHGGLADRSGLLHPGDLLVEVNGNPVVGLDPEQVIHILANSQGTILFKVIPNPSQVSSSQAPVCMRAMVDYSPLQDSSIPCPDAGMAFSRGDLLQVVDQSDGQWWQARKLPCATFCAGLIPSASMLKSKQREQWWCQPLQVHTCIRPLTLAANENDPGHSDEKHAVTDLEEINFDEPESDITDGIYLAGFRRSFRVWKRTSYRKRRQSCTTCSPNSNALSTPYEEVVLYQRPPQENHRLIILVGASGVGVNELRKRLIKLNPSTFQGPVPHTTRPIRAGEQTGREYHFVTKELFEYMVCNHRFVEYGESKGQLYGISTDAIDEVLKRGRMCIIDAEPHSIQLLRTKKFKPYVIFIKPPSPERLRQTRRDARIITNYAINRVFTEEDFVELEETSQLIEAKYKQFFDSVLVNCDLQDTCIQLCSIIQQAQDEPQWIPVSWGRAED